MFPPEILRLIGEKRAAEIECDAVADAAQVMSDKSLYGFACRDMHGRRVDPSTLSPTVLHTTSRLDLHG